MPMKVLWLASWYPNRTEPFNGDFIERHAVATAPFTEHLFVIAPVKDDAMEKGATEIIKKQSGNLTVYIAYYGRSKWAIAEKLLSFGKYFLLQKKIYKAIQLQFGTINIGHVHVPMNAGLFARYLQKFSGIPYVVTEHWGGYKRVAKPNIDDVSRYMVWLRKGVIKHASRFLPVTDDLGQYIDQHFVNVQYKVIPNVVNTGLFFYKPYTPTVFRFIHPSCMNYPKNPEGILLACKVAKEKGLKFELLMLGNKDEALQRLAEQLGLLNEYVFFEAPVPYRQVAVKMQHSSALLMFSRYENLPCIILEALCCGLPVISSRVGGIAEVIDSSNGILVQSGNINELVEAMAAVIQNYSGYNREAISLKAKNLYNYAAIGKQYADVYEEVLNGNKKTIDQPLH